MNTKKFVTALLALWCVSGAVRAEDTSISDVSAQKPAPSRIPLYSVSSNEFDSTDAINRISGDIDMGFGAPSQYSGMLSPSISPQRPEDY